MRKQVQKIGEDLHRGLLSAAKSRPEGSGVGTKLGRTPSPPWPRGGEGWGEAELDWCRSPHPPSRSALRHPLPHCGRVFLAGLLAVLFVDDVGLQIGDRLHEPLQL